VSSLTTGELAMQLLRRHAQAFTQHAVEARLEDTDPEHVHQTRVATRRLRAALRVFDDVLPAEVKTLRDDLAWIAGQLGPVRDLDVQLLRLQDTAAELAESDALAPYAAWLEGQRQRAFTTLKAAFEYERFDELTQRLEVLHNVSPGMESAPVSEDAPKRLKGAYRTLRRRAGGLSVSSPPAGFHKARIAAKRVRYTTEFFEPAYGKPARRLIAEMVSLQDLLGDHQDGIVSVQRVLEAVQTTAGEWPAETSLALGRVVQWEAQHGYELRRHFKRAFREVDDAWQRLQRAL
jgi:CHAD domain-containing protein